MLSKERHQTATGPLFAQVIINLIVNASQACGHSGLIRIDLAASQTRRIRISIADNGPGIPDADVDKIFTPFYTSGINKNGSGLGLSVVKQIINKSGGVIHIGKGLAQPKGRGFGCVFTLDIPFIT
jgi:two-component system NtrC family sensor kinase